MPRLKWTGHGVFRDGQSGVVAGPGPGRPLIHDVDEETARRFLDQGGWVRLDDEGGGDGDADTDPDDRGDTDDAAAEPDTDDFDSAAFVDRTPMSEVIEDLESGDYDDRLDAIEAAEREGRDREGVAEAIAARR